MSFARVIFLIILFQFFGLRSAAATEPRDKATSALVQIISARQIADNADEITATWKLKVQIVKLINSDINVKRLNFYFVGTNLPSSGLLFLILERNKKNSFDVVNYFSVQRVVCIDDLEELDLHDMPPVTDGVDDCNRIID